MIKIFTTIIMLCATTYAFCQTDTIFLNNGKIPCVVKEVTEDAVVFVYPGEEVTNRMYKNAIQKIVFKSGRTQTFSEATSLKEIKNARDYDKVTITAVESEIKGLFKLGDVSAKAVGTTEFSNQERVKNRAYRKMKIVAAMMGANIIYLTSQRNEGNKIGYWTSQTAETNLTGVAYTNILPDFNEFKALIEKKNGTDFTQILELSLWGSDSDIAESTIKKPFKIENITNDNGLIMLNNDKYRVVNFDDEGFNIYYRTKSKWFNVRISFEDTKK